MGLFDKLFGRSSPAAPATPARFGIAELTKRLTVDAAQLQAIRPHYQTFTIPKRSGGQRQILAPADDLKKIQRTILRRLLSRLAAHDAAHGFETTRSIVTNARPHARAAIVLRLDLKDFFTTTSAKRVEQYFRTIGWDADCAKLLTNLCCHAGGLPQGAPTSPRLSNLVNIRLDARLQSLAKQAGATYTRYADDLTFSFNPKPEQRHAVVNTFIRHAKQVLKEEGYTLHTDRKLKIHHRHDRQQVTGLVVNEKVQLPRAKRRWLRAVEHHVASGKPATLTPQQLQGWRSLTSMIEQQSKT